jgi:hypothetical protein
MDTHVEEQRVLVDLLGEMRDGHTQSLLRRHTLPQIETHTYTHSKREGECGGDKQTGRGR